MISRMNIFYKDLGTINYIPLISVMIPWCHTKNQSPDISLSDTLAKPTYLQCTMLLRPWYSGAPNSDGGNCNTPLEHTPGNPPSQLWKESPYSLLVKVARGCVPVRCVETTLESCHGKKGIYIYISGYTWISGSSSLGVPYMVFVCNRVSMKTPIP